MFIFQMSQNVWASVTLAGLSGCVYYYWLPQKTKLRSGLSFGMGINAGAAFFNVFYATPTNWPGFGINLAAMLFLHLATRNPESQTRPAFPPMDESEKLHEEKIQD